jgi:hypothetical protein
MGLSHIRITTMQPQFNSSPPVSHLRKCGMQRVIVVGVICMDHPFGTISTHNCEISVVINNVCTQNDLLKKSGRVRDFLISD